MLDGRINILNGPSHNFAFVLAKLHILFVAILIVCSTHISHFLDALNAYNAVILSS